MKKLILLVLMVLLLISSNCKNEKSFKPISVVIKDIKAPLKLVKEKEVKIDVIIRGSAVIGKIDSSNHVFIQFSSDKDKHVWRYNTSLELEKKFLIPYGQGPGECLTPMIIGGDDNLDDIERAEKLDLHREAVTVSGGGSRAGTAKAQSCAEIITGDVFEQ